jgi:hypothetical protein
MIARTLTPAWFLHINISYVTFRFPAFITVGRYQTWERCCDLRDRYRRWIVVGVEKAAEETASERSSEIDVRIFDWTVSALGDDDSLENFF